MQKSTLSNFLQDIESNAAVAPSPKAETLSFLKQYSKALQCLPTGAVSSAPIFNN